MFLGAEFISLLILIIYIGAIAILFLFVIMMLNLRIIEVYNAFFNYLPIGSLIAFFFIGEILILIIYDFAKIDLLLDIKLLNDNFILKGFGFNNLQYFGQLLFNNFISYFLIIGLILFSSMIGSIIILINTTKIRMQNKKVIMNYKIFKTESIKLWKH